MNKFFSTLMLLAMMVAALSLTACGGSDDDEGIGGDDTSDYAFTITYDGELNKYGTAYFKAYSEAAVWHNSRHEFFLGITQPYGQIFWQFPPTVDSSSFSVGYDNFDCSILWESFNGGVYGHDGQYTSGSATVVSNDGKYIGVRFSKYTFSFNTETKSHTMEINGTIKFLIK